MKYFVVIFFTLLLTNFFGATALGSTILLGIVLPLVVLEFSKKSVFKGYIIILFLGLSMSIISCYYYRAQPIFQTFRATAPYYYIIFYFMLKYINLPIQSTEKALTTLFLIFCACYIIQYLIFPTILFSGAQNEKLATEDLRIRLTGQGFSSLGYFFGLNKFLKDKKKIYHLLLAILCFGVIFLMGFRTMMVMIAIFSLILVIRVKGFSWKLLVYTLLLCGVFIAFLQIPVFAYKIDSMLGRQQENVLTNKDYIRVIQFQYYTQEHFKSVWEYIFGSGVPALEIGQTSRYSTYMSGLLDRGLTWVDFGLLSISWIIGIISVLAMIGYSIKAFLLKVPSDYYYLGIWFIYLISSSFTTAEFYRSGNFIVQALALYLVEKVHNRLVRVQQIT
jgi:hypothetical protein